MLENMAAARKAADDETDSVYDYPLSSNFRHYRDRRLLDGGPFVMLNLGTDGFQFFRKNGFEGWPVTATLLSMSPEERTRNKHQLPLFVTPGPRQPVNLESFLHPIAEELNDLAKGVPGLIVPNSATPVMLRAGVLHFTTDHPMVTSLPILKELAATSTIWYGFSRACTCLQAATCSTNLRTLGAEGSCSKYTTVLFHAAQPQASPQVQLKWSTRAHPDGR